MESLRMCMTVDGFRGVAPALTKSDLAASASSGWPSGSQSGSTARTMGGLQFARPAARSSLRTLIKPLSKGSSSERDAHHQALSYEKLDDMGLSIPNHFQLSPAAKLTSSYNSVANMRMIGRYSPGGYFARTLLAKLPDNVSVGLVPFAVNGSPIKVFRKGVPRPGWTLPPDDHWETGYEWTIDRATKAQKYGEISGILYHQGESDESNADWADQVAQLVADLRVDLVIGEEVPFVIGELLESGCCGDRNDLINSFTSSIPNAWVASASGLAGTDTFHFDLAGQRELGRRYGEQMITALGL